jgi:hypothetical protein
LNTIINSYTKPSLNNELLMAALDVAYSQNIHFSQLLARLSLPLPDTYTSLSRVADNHASTIPILRATFDRIARAYTCNPKDFLSLMEALIAGKLPTRIVCPLPLSVHAVTAYSTIMNPYDFERLSRCLTLAHTFTLFNDVNRYIPLAYAHDLDLALTKLLPHHNRIEDWPWNHLLRIYPTLK